MDITWDRETNGLLNETSIDYLSSPYRLKPSFKTHSIVVQEHQTGKIIAFYDGDTYKLDGREFEESKHGRQYTLKDYSPIEYQHRPLKAFKEYILEGDIDKVVAHNQINFDLLVGKLEDDMDYTIEEDTWCNKVVDFKDTLVISKTQNPDRFGGHSLDALAEKTGDKKIQFRKGLHESVRYLDFAADMLYYNIKDVIANTAVYKWLLEERAGWNWEPAIKLEKAVAWIITNQEHRGFKFDKVLAETNIAELDILMEERRIRAEPVIPTKTPTQAFMKTVTPPTVQFLKGGGYSSYIKKFVQKHNGKLLSQEKDFPLKVEILGKVYELPIPQHPLITEVRATLDDSTHIKNWLVGLGWVPSEYKEKDLSVKSGKGKPKRTRQEFEAAVDDYVEQTLNCNFCEDRCDHLETSRQGIKDKLLKTKDGKGCKVLTNPNFTKGQEKEICPNLLAMGEKFPFARDVVDYLTYKHRRNSILGGGLEWDEEEEAEKGYMAYVREDGRIATPADTCGAACVVAETLIVSDKGLVPIVKVNKGDLVLTHNGVYSKVIEKIHNRIKPVAEISFDSGNSVTATFNHPFLTPDGWKRLDELLEGDSVFFYQGREEWGQVENLSNYYVSSWGRVVSVSGETIQLSSRKSLWDRANVDLIDDTGTKHRYGIGRLVLEIWEGLCPAGKECCHKDGNPTNNFIKNLYWGTSKDNSADAKIHGRALKASRSKSKLSQESVNEIREYFLHFGHRRGDDTLLANKYDVSREHIRDIRLNKRWREGNTVNLYKEDYFLTKVVSISYRGEQPTFDLTVEDHHSYLANGVVCHNTSRFKHKVVANIPRVTSLYGEKMRGMFCVGEQHYQLGYDFDSLEAKMESSYCWRYDETKEYCNSLTMDKPNDVHTVLAAKISKLIGRTFNRTPAKSTKYAATYGATEKKIAKTIGESLHVGSQVFTAFWQAALPLDSLKIALKRYWETVGGKKFILGIDGRKVPTRSAHAILNSLFQSAGVICAKKAMVLHYHKLKQEGLIVDFFREDWKSATFCQQLVAYHDEAQCEVSKRLVKFKMFGTKEEAQAFKDSQTQVWSDIKESPKGGVYVAYCRAGELASEAVNEAGSFYRLNVPLTAGYIIGRSWADCH